jgi:DNA-binding transcriptional ArsR family regulator
VRADRPVGLSQPTVSHHLKILVDAGILTREQRGKWGLLPAGARSLGRLGCADHLSGGLTVGARAPTR